MTKEAKLQKIQEELKAPKGQYNSFGKYHYRSCEDILEAVKPLAAKYNCVVVLSDTVEQIGNRYYIKSTARIIDTDCDLIENSISASAIAREADDKKGMDAAQITGSCSSYARKYALNGLFCIDDTKDADTDESHAQSKQVQPHRKQDHKPVTEQQKNKETVSDMAMQNINKALILFRDDTGADVKDTIVMLESALGCKLDREMHPSKEAEIYRLLGEWGPQKGGAE